MAFIKLQLSSTQGLSNKAIRILLKRLLASPSGEQGRTFKGCLQIVQENVGGHVNVCVHVYLVQVSVFLGMSMEWEWALVYRLSLCMGRGREGEMTDRWESCSPEGNSHIHPSIH